MTGFDTEKLSQIQIETDFLHTFNRPKPRAFPRNFLIPSLASFLHPHPPRDLSRFLIKPLTYQLVNKWAEEAREKRREQYHLIKKEREEEAQEFTILFLFSALFVGNLALLVFG